MYFAAEIILDAEFSRGIQMHVLFAYVKGSDYQQAAADRFRGLQSEFVFT